MTQTRGNTRLPGDDGYFGEDVAADYDAASAEMFRPEVVEPAVDLLAGLAGDGRALELGVGTGRIALPLSRRGVPVHGIELSRAMAERLRAKPGGHAVGVTIGDFAATRVPGAADTFTLAYLVFNTINNLTTQDAQVDCFRNAAAHLAPGGRFVVEVGVPALRLLPPGQDTVPFQSSARGWGFDTIDTTTQRMSSHYFTLTEDHAEHRSMPFRYVWPAELDLMARLAGMHLTDRWQDWTREPFTHESTRHVSVWEKREN
ncbi:class I SAM-dependent methyltransferase [Streptomyces sp. ODS28]|uniref:class I SAM-dependent DNA methyltransferase n=1 Tax=Streptomyces sp. ODS28 TaxID=3136688 RepID=UPI0031F1B042